MTFAEVRDELIAQDPRVGAKKMFGHDCLNAMGKGFAIDFEGDMVFKLSGNAHADALELSGSHLFDPMGGRPMKEWVQVGSENSERWVEFGLSAAEYVASLAK